MCDAAKMWTNDMGVDKEEYLHIVSGDTQQWRI